MYLNLCRTFGIECADYREDRSPKCPKSLMPGSIHFFCRKKHELISEDRRDFADYNLLKPVKKRLSGHCVTTGILAIAWMMRYYEPVYLAGFGPKKAFVDERRVGRKSTCCKNHAWDMERRIINRWEFDGLVKRCDA
jgi:hypothetical protein